MVHRNIDSDGMHVNTTIESLKMTIKYEGIYRLEQRLIGQDQTQGLGKINL